MATTRLRATIPVIPLTDGETEAFTRMQTVAEWRGCNAPQALLEREPVAQCLSRLAVTSSGHWGGGATRREAPPAPATRTTQVSAPGCHPRLASSASPSGLRGRLPPQRSPRPPAKPGATPLLPETFTVAATSFRSLVICLLPGSCTGHQVSLEG